MTIDDHERHHARQQVANHATDLDEEWMLIDMLGLA